MRIALVDQAGGFLAAAGGVVILQGAQLVNNGAVEVLLPGHLGGAALPVAGKGFFRQVSQPPIAF